MALKRYFSYITNPKFGRRTGTHVLGGKTVKKLPDGSELFDDYWTDSENEQVSDSPTNNKENAVDNRNESCVSQANFSGVGGDTPFTKSYRSNLSTDGNSTASMANARKGVCFQNRRTLKFSNDQTPVQKSNEFNDSVMSQFSTNNSVLESYSLDVDNNTYINKSQRGKKDASRQNKTPVNSNKKQNKSSLDRREEKELNDLNRSSSNRKRKMTETEKMDSEKRVKKSKGRKLLAPPPSYTPTPGVRRSKRTRVQPLEFWRNQRIKYDKEHKTIGIEEGFELMERKKVGKKKSSNSKITKSTNRLQISNCANLSVHDKSFVNATMSSNDSNKLQVYSVNDFMNRDLAMPEFVSFYKSLEWVTPEGNEPSKDDPLQIAKSLSFHNVMTGFMKICSLQEKPLQYFPKHSIIFNVLYGKVAVKIEDTTFILETGDTFHVPVGNSYSIKNVRRDEVKLYLMMLPVPEELEECQV